MADSTDAFWTLEGRTPDVPEGLERDRWGRPLIIGPDGERRAYTRMSTIAGKLEDRKGLETWKRRMAMRGVAITPELAAMVAGMPEKTGNRRKDDLTAAMWREHEERAMDRAGAHTAANWGTSTHSFTEPGMRGNPAVPEKIQGDVDSYWGMIDDYEVICLASEVFVVNHELRIAGTFDDLYWVPGFGICLGDKKSGKKKVKSAAMQMAGYANSEVYDIETGQCRPISSLVDWHALGINPMHHNRETAFFIHVELGKSTTTFYAANLVKAFEAVKMACWVRDFQSDNDGWVRDAHEEIMRAQRDQEARRAIHAATSVGELEAIANEFLDIWHDDLTHLGRVVMASWT